MKKLKRIAAFAAAACMVCAPLTLAGCANNGKDVVLRVCSWEEYIDLGGWKEDEVIDLKSGDIFGENSMVDDFTQWFNQNHDYNIRVEYSTFGTNEDLYNRLSLGDVYDLVCPSDYMIMKLLSEDACVEYSDGFWDTNKEENYYAKYVSRYIDGKEGETNGGELPIFNKPEYNWHKKAACYMWGTTGLVYNPESVDDEADVSTWKMLLNSNYKRQVTIKDNVRDAYFAALGIVYNDLLTADEISAKERAELMNKVTPDAISAAEDVLKQIKENVYSFETDSGKSDMVTGKVVANFQWSGDAVYIMDEADEDDTELWYSVPDECANLWFDGWVMLKNGVGEDAKKKEAAEAFVNFLSRPDNAVRNMYYIGYTSAIAGQTVYDYMEWNYGADDEVAKEDIGKYDLSYFFGKNTYLSVDTSLFGFEGEWEDGQINRGRQLFAQYPPENVIERSVVMLDFGDKLADLNQMWINVRCFSVSDISPVTIGIAAGVIVLAAAGICLYVLRYRIFLTGKPKKGYKKAV